jgi:hypothetical protein
MLKNISLKCVRPWLHTSGKLRGKTRFKINLRAEKRPLKITGSEIKEIILLKLFRILPLLKMSTKAVANLSLTFLTVWHLSPITGITKFFF